MFNVKTGTAFVICAVSLVGGISAMGRPARSDDAPADAKSAMDKLQFMVGRFTLMPVKAKASDSATGFTAENTLGDNGTTIHMVVRNGSTASGEKVLSYDPDKHMYHVTSTAESQDTEPQLSGTLSGGALVLEQAYPSTGSTGLVPRVHDGIIEVMRVFPGMAAEKAGLRRGDVIVKIDGKPLSGDHPNMMLVGAPDTTVVVTVRRRGEEHDVTIHRMGTVKTYQQTISPRKGGGYRLVTKRTDVHGMPSSGSDAVPVGH